MHELHPEHLKEAQKLLSRLIINLNDWITTYDTEPQEIQEAHDSCRDGYAVIRHIAQQLNLLLEKDNCA